MIDNSETTMNKDKVEPEMSQREEREATDRAFASNDKLQFDNLIHQERLIAANEKVQFDNAMALSNARNNNSVDHSNNTAKYAEIALANAVNFQQQMNQEYLRDVNHAREHANELHHVDKEHNDLTFHHSKENDRYTLDRLYSVFPEEAAGLVALLRALVENTKATDNNTKATEQK